MSRKLIILLVALGIVIVGLGHYVEDMGNVMGTRVVMEEVSDSDLSADEIFDAIEVVRKDFRKTFRDCTLTDLTYDLDQNDEDKRQEIARKHQVQEAVLVSGNLKANRTHEELGVEKGDTYTGYVWLVTRSAADGDWEIRTYNYQADQDK